MVCVWCKMSLLDGRLTIIFFFTSFVQRVKRAMCVKWLVDGSLIDKIVIIIYYSYVNWFIFIHWSIEMIVVISMDKTVCHKRYTMKEHKSITHVYGWKTIWSLEVKWIALYAQTKSLHFFSSASFIVYHYIDVFPNGLGQMENWTK